MLAEAALFGIPVDRLLRTKDPTERALLVSMHKEAQGVVDDLLTNLARKIVEEYAKAQNRGAKR
jgi:hypothetical protein